MTNAFEEPHWNLAQAWGWVCWRTREIVERLKYGDWRAAAVYPPSEGVGDARDLLAALRNGKVKATGKFRGGMSQEIPASEWSSFQSLSDCQKAGWSDVLLSRKELMKFWPGDGVSAPRGPGRPHKFSPDRMRKAYLKAKRENPGLADTESDFLDKFRDAYIDLYPGRDIPSDRTLRRFISSERVSSDQK